MQSQTNSSLKSNQTEAVLIETLLDQAQHSLLESNSQNRFTEKRDMLNSAKRIAEDVLVLDNTNPDAHHILALSHTLLGESSRAKRHIAKAFELSEPSGTLMLEKAHIDLAAGHYNKAERGFNEVLKQDPANADAFLGMAITRQKKKDWGSAFLHYNSLINKDIVTDAIINGLVEVIQHIDVELWTPEYEKTLLTGLHANHVNKSAFGKFSNTLLAHKYHLELADSELDFAALIEDPLLFEIVAQKLIMSAETEQLVSLLRETLLTQIYSAKHIPPVLEKWVICLAEAAAYYGYSWPVNDQEMVYLSELSHAISAEVKSSDKDTSMVENSTGAILLYSMYEELYAAPFSYLLMAKTLTDWPRPLHALLASSLYEPARLHEIEVELKRVIAPSQSSLIYERDPLVPYPKWSHIQVSEEQSATRFLLNTFGERLPFKSRKRPLNVLVSASGTGQHILQLAHQFNDINLVGADDSIARLAYAEYQARNLEIDNIRWVHCAETKLTCLNQRFDVVDWSTPLNHHQDLIASLNYVKRLMADTGIAKLRVELNHERASENLLKKLASTNHLPANLGTLRNVRRAILEDAGKGDWQDIYNHPGFYHSGACLQMIFGNEHHSLQAQAIDEALQTSQLELMGVADKPASKVSIASSISGWEKATPLKLELPKHLVLFVKKQ